MFIVSGVVVGAAACGSNGTKGVGTGAGGAGGTGTTTHTSGSTTTTASTTTTSTATTIPPAGGHDAGCAPSENAGTAGFPFPPMTTSGGSLITALKLVNIIFPTESSEAMPSTVAAFGDPLASTCYWDAVRAGYCQSGTTGCVGDGPTGVTIQLSTPAAAMYTDPFNTVGTLPTFLQGLITAGTVPAPDDNTLYAMYFPESTIIDMGGAKSCQAFDGYHSGMQMGNQNVWYAVINECSVPQGAGITTFQNTTLTASHEAIEAATDSNNGYYLDLTNESTWGWSDVQGGGEVADLCVDPFGLGLDEFTENGFTAQRSWSILNASAGKNPCVPIPAGEVYFNAYSKNSVLVMDVGASKTVEVDALADGTMPAWTVLPQDWTEPCQTNTDCTAGTCDTNAGYCQYLSFSINATADAGADAGSSTSTQMQSGDKMMLTVTLLADPTNTYGQEADAVLVSANNADPKSVTAAHFWPFVVVNSAFANDAGITMMKHHRHERDLAGRRVKRHRRYRNVFGGWR
jgi:hypothetical protein